MKSNVDEKLIGHIADVARLKLSEKEKKQFLEELKEILEAFSRIDEVDTKNIEVSLQPVELKNVLREDREEKCLSQEEALSLAQHKKDGYFKGPRAV